LSARRSVYEMRTWQSLELICDDPKVDKDALCIPQRNKKDHE
jgi:hypothetical protein